jgi:hypothetical protein
VVKRFTQRLGVALTFGVLVFAIAAHVVVGEQAQWLATGTAIVCQVVAVVCFYRSS